MKSHPVIGTMLALLITGIAAAFGFAFSADDPIAATVFAAIAGLDVRIQSAILVALLVMVIVPAIAPYTPWTWDDRTITYRSQAVKLLGLIWNALAGNVGRASNSAPDAGNPSGR